MPVWNARATDPYGVLRIHRQHAVASALAAPFLWLEFSAQPCPEDEAYGCALAMDSIHVLRMGGIIYYFMLFVNSTQG